MTRHIVVKMKIWSVLDGGCEKAIELAGVKHSVRVEGAVVKVADAPAWIEVSREDGGHANHREKCGGRNFWETNVADNMIQEQQDAKVQASARTGWPAHSGFWNLASTRITFKDHKFSYYPRKSYVY